MEIAPNGNIWLLHNVPLDNTYEHTIYWSLSDPAVSKINQKNWFVNHYLKRSFTRQTYTRLNRGIIRVEVLSDDIYDCNYLIFQNDSFGDKYFYAFIKSVEYINNAVSEIQFEIDVIQTWYFDYDLRPCFLERTHTRTDVIGDNIVPEPVEVGEYMYNGLSKETVTSQLCIIMSIVDVANYSTSTGKVYGHIFGGSTLWAFDPDDVAGIINKITQYLSAPDSIVAMYMCPKCLLSVTVPSVGGVQLAGTDIKTGETTLVTAFPLPSSTDTFGSYTPHNKKLYTYPYTMLEVFTPTGGTLKLRYEFFKNNTPAFVYGGSATVPVELVLAPVDYKMYGSGLSAEPLYNESLTLRDYPLCSWNTDAYQAWIAQNAIPMLIGAAADSASGYLGVVSGFLSKSPVGVAMGGLHAVSNSINGIKNSLIETYKAAISADKLHGESKGSANVSMETQGFYFGKRIINESSARTIDAFFDMYGYAIKRIVEPVRKNRRYYTFIQTIGCVLDASVPADDANYIATIHDHGITYWDAEEVPISPSTGYPGIGDYSLAGLNIPIG